MRGRRARPGPPGQTVGRGPGTLPASVLAACLLVASSAVPSLPGEGLLRDLLAGPALAQAGAAPTIRLQPEEEALFRDLLARDPAAPAALDGPVAVGTMVPIAVPLQVFPGPVMAAVPATRGLRYVRTAGGVVVVDPDTRRVVQILAPAPRP